jgi:predicted nicotinamide N-methyase
MEDNNKLLKFPETEELYLSIAGYKLAIEKVKNLDDYLEEIAEEANEDDDLIPYWSEVWPSSIAMGEYLAENREQLKSKRILELGCGIGVLASLMARLKFNFLSTDFQPLALKLAEKNVTRNSGRNYSIKFLDWRKPDLNEKFDCIIASDVLYERRFFMPLLDLFRKLKKKNGKTILAEPNRSVAKPFFDILREQGYLLNRQERTVEQSGKRINISIWEIS